MRDARRAILETNIVQTVVPLVSRSPSASGHDSGDLDPRVDLEVTLVIWSPSSVASRHSDEIPLRRALIVQQHGILKYPEGTAAPKSLKARRVCRVACRCD